MDLKYIEINPKQHPIGAVIWLHGLGADGHDFAPIVPHLGIPDTIPLRFVFPHAPEKAITINNGYIMRAWYDIVSFDFDQRADANGIIDSCRLITRLIEEQINKGIPAEKIVLAGFSQGAAIALTLGLTFPQKIAGIMALSGYLPQTEVLQNISSANQNTPIFIAHGTEDQIVPFTLSETLAAKLTNMGHPVSWHAYKMPHSVCNEEIAAIGEWLKELF